MSFANSNIQWARVRFEDYDNNFYDLPVNYIKFSKKDKTCIEPKSKSDFVSTHHYYVRWDCDEGCQEIHSDEKHYAYYKARICLLGVSKEAIEEDSRSKRIRTSTRVDTTSTSQVTDDGSYDEKSTDEEPVPAIKPKKTVLKKLLKKSRKMSSAATLKLAKMAYERASTPINDEIITSGNSIFDPINGKISPILDDPRTEPNTSCCENVIHSALLEPYVVVEKSSKASSYDFNNNQWNSSVSPTSPLPSDIPTVTSNKSNVNNQPSGSRRSRSRSSRSRRSDRSRSSSRRSRSDRSRAMSSRLRRSNRSRSSSSRSRSDRSRAMSSRSRRSNRSRSSSSRSRSDRSRPSSSRSRRSGRSRLSSRRSRSYRSRSRSHRSRRSRSSRSRLYRSRRSRRSRSAQHSLRSRSNSSSVLDQRLDFSSLIQELPEGIKSPIRSAFDVMQDQIDYLNNQLAAQNVQLRKKRVNRIDSDDEEVNDERLLDEQAEAQFKQAEAELKEELDRLGQPAGNNMIYIGLEKYYNKTLWEMINSKKPQKLLRFLLKQYYPKPLLRNKCIVEEDTTVEFNGERREELTYKELKIIEVHLVNKCNASDTTGALAELWKSIYKKQIGYAIQDARRKPRRKKKKSRRS